MTNWIWLYEKKLAINMKWNWIDNFRLHGYDNIFLWIVIKFPISVVELKDFDKYIFRKEQKWARYFQVT